MSGRRPHDVCVIGSGFAGTFLGLRLVERGIDTLIVEAGGDLSPDAPPEGRTGIFPHLLLGDAAFPVDFNRSIGVGGTSHKWNGVVSRMLPSDFRSRSEFGLFEDWPITYEDLEPYYDQAEPALETRWIGPSGGREGDHPPVLTGLDDLRLSLAPFSVRVHRGGPIRLGDVEIPRFLASARGTLLAERPATRLVTDGNGTVLSVEVRCPDGTTETIGARQVVIAAGVMETVRLLLVSRSSAFPLGIGNWRDLVGRYVQAHPRPRLHVPRQARFENTRCLLRSLRYCDEFRKNGMASVCVDFNFFEEDPAVDVTLETEPVATNRIYIDPRREDGWGRPIAVLDCTATECDRRTHAAALRIQRGLAREILAPGQVGRDAEPKYFHPAGGCRMSRDAEHGVVDENGLVFGTENLYVAGAAVFPTSGTANPTLTIVAMAYRLGDHLAAKLWAS